MDILRYLISLFLLFLICGVFTLIWSLIINRFLTIKITKVKESFDISHLKKKSIEPHGVNVKHRPITHNDADLYEREKNSHNV